MDNIKNTPAGDAEVRNRRERPERDFLVILNRFLAHQEEVLHLAEFIASRRPEIDDQKERARAQIALDFPHAKDDLFDETWDAIRRLLSDDDDDDASPESDAEPEAGEASQEPDAVPEAAGSEGIAAQEPALEANDADSASTRSEKQADASYRDKLDRGIEAVIDGIDIDGAPEYFLSVLRAQGLESNATPRLLSSLLTNLVGDFEVLLGNLLRIMLAKNTSGVGASDRQFTWSEISKFESLDAFKDHVFDTAVDNLLRASYRDWLKYFRDKFKISTPDCSESAFILEALQRRHVIVHNGGRVSQQYLEKVPEEFASAPVGHRLQVDTKYLGDVADNLLVTAMSLVCVAAFKTLKDEDSRTAIERRAGDILYRLMQNGRYAPVRDLVKAHSSEHFKDPYTSLVWKINGWLAHKRLGEFAACEKEVKNWETAVLQSQFRLAKHALLDEHKEALRIVEEIRGTEALPLRHWAAWPLLAELRDYEIEQKLKVQA